MKLGEIIKKFRYDNDMTMQEFADKSGLSKGYISMLEKNKHPQSKRELVPSFETYKKVASAMCMPLDDFLAALDGDEVVKVNAAAPAPAQLVCKENTSTRLKQIMQERNLRQVDVLERTIPLCRKYDVKMNKSDISQYVSGKVEPNQDKLFVLSLALNVSEGWLMGFDVSKARASAPADPLQLTEQEKHIISIYHDLDRVGQEKFTAFGEGLLAAARAEDRRGYYTFTPYEKYMVAESGPEYQMWSNKVNDQLMEDADRIAKKEIENASDTKKMVK